MKTNKFNLLVDASWGSSAKGAVSGRLVDIYKTPNVSTNNYPNAGHTIKSGESKFVSKVLPTPAGLNMIGRAKPTLWLGPGSSFFTEQLGKELTQTGYNASELMVHERAIVASQRHLDMEAPGGDQSTEHISSTMSGSGSSFSEKAMRRPQVQLASTVDGLHTLSPTKFAMSLRAELKQGRGFLHEVSQGYALSINYGTHYPNCTFRDCTPQQAAADMMLLPDMIGDVYLNVRSLPIRVGNNFRDGKQTGYSGNFMPDQVELTWEQVAKDAEMPPDEAAGLAERERTTVTKKIRRVATQSWELLQQAAVMTGATKLVLNFPQYIHWSAYGLRGGHEVIKTLHPKVREYLDKMEAVTGLPVVMIGTSAEHDDYIFLD